MFHTQIRLEIDGLSKVQRFTEAMLSDYRRAWKVEMMRRALLAYLRQGGTRMPCKYRSRIATSGQKHYAYLADETGTLAVYRIGSKSAFKRKAVRWPKSIENFSMFRQGLLLYAGRQDIKDIESRPQER